MRFIGKSSAYHAHSGFCWHDERCALTEAACTVDYSLATSVEAQVYHGGYLRPLEEGAYGPPSTGMPLADRSGERRRARATGSLI